MKDYQNLYKQIVAIHKGLRATAEQIAQDKPFLWVSIKAPVWLCLYSLEDYKSLVPSKAENLPEMVERGLTIVGNIELGKRYNNQAQALISLGKNKKQVIPLGLSFWLGCGGENPSDSDMANMLANHLLGNFLPEKIGVMEIAGKINPSNFNDYAYIESLSFVFTPNKGEDMRAYLARAKDYFSMAESQSAINEKYASDFLARVKTSPKEVFEKIWELAKEVREDARTSEVVYTKVDFASLYYGSQRNVEEIREIKNDAIDLLASLKAGDGKAKGLEELFNWLNEADFSLEQNIYYPSNTAILPLDRLFSNFVPEKDEEKIKKALEWKAKLESKKPTLAKLRGELKELKAQVDAMKAQAYPDDDKLAELERAKQAKEEEIAKYRADLEEGGRNILVRNGKVYRNANAVETRYNDMGEIEETYKGATFTTTITKGEAWAERESTGKPGLARFIQSEIFRKCKQSQSLSGTFTNEEICKAVLGDDGYNIIMASKSNSMRQQLVNAKQMFWDYIQVLAHTFINSAKVVVGSEASKRRGKKDSELITGTLITCIKSREGVSFTLNETLFRWAIFGETPYITASEWALSKLPTPRSKNAFRGFRQLEITSTRKTGNYKVSTLINSNPEYQTPENYQGKNKTRDIDDNQWKKDFEEWEKAGLMSIYEPRGDMVHAFSKEGEEEAKEAKAKRERARKRKAKGK